MGGTFDPPHLGHLISAEYVLEALELDEIIFVPTGKKVYKDGSVASDSDRMNMTIAAVESNKKFKVSDIEISNNDINYTSETLEKLHRLNPNVHYYFIVGADSLDYMEDWHKPEKIFRLCTVATVGRTGFDESSVKEKVYFFEKKYDADIKYVRAPLIDISSSQIRYRIKDGLSVKYLVGDSVEKYIKDKGLYIK